MFKNYMVVLFVLFVCVTSAFALVVAGVDMPNTLTIGKETLVLNGAGVRAKKIAFFNKDLYVAGLYLKEKNHNAQEIINADETMVLRIKIISSLITSERFKEAADEGFKEATHGNTAPIQKDIDTFLSAFSGKINNGDLIEIIYSKGVGIQVSKNGSDPLPAAITGMPIKKAVFGIWLGDRTEKNLQALAKQLMGIEAVK